jgi:drug/metabolite transporter (DMT)-like permease
MLRCFPGRSPGKPRSTHRGGVAGFWTILRDARLRRAPQDEGELRVASVTDPKDSSTRAGAARALTPALRGIGWMVASGALFSLLNAAQKFLAHELHPPQVLCLRYLAGSAVLLPFIVQAGWAAYRPAHLPLLMLRGSVHLVGTIIWFLVLPHVTLAENSAIGFTGPIFMMLGAWLFMGERMDAMRWAAVLVAFAGVLIVLAPGLVEANLGTVYSLWLLVASPIFAISFLMSKALTRYDRPEAIVFWLGIMVGLLSLPFALSRITLTDTGVAVDITWQWPTFLQWGLLFGCGLVGSTAHYCMTRAYHIADVSVVQPVRFLDLVWASLLGFVVFAHLPTVWALAGGSVICAATLWITRREARRPAV